MFICSNVYMYADCIDVFGAYIIPIFCVYYCVYSNIYIFK